MTTELEEQFFKAFGIEPKYIDGCKLNDKYFADEQLQKEYETLDDYMAFECPHQNEYCYSTCQYAYDCSEYPKITDRKLLEMICIILDTEGLLTINTEGNIADIKDFVLRFLIGKVNKNPYCHYKTKNKIKHQIQQLFKEEE